MVDLDKLGRLIQATILFLNEMQRAYNDETGRDFVISGPMQNLGRIEDEISRYFRPPHKTAKEIINEADWAYQGAMEHFSTLRHYYLS